MLRLCNCINVNLSLILYICYPHADSVCAWLKKTEVVIWNISPYANIVNKMIYIEWKYIGLFPDKAVFNPFSFLCHIHDCDQPECVKSQVGLLEDIKLLNKDISCYFNVYKFNPIEWIYSILVIDKGVNISSWKLPVD